MEECTTGQAAMLRTEMSLVLVSTLSAMATSRNAHRKGGIFCKKYTRILSIIFLKKNTGCFKKMLLTDFLALFLLGKCLNKKQYFLNP